MEQDIKEEMMETIEKMNKQIEYERGRYVELRNILDKVLLRNEYLEKEYALSKSIYDCNQKISDLIIERGELQKERFELLSKEEDDEK